MYSVEYDQALSIQEKPVPQDYRTKVLNDAMLHYTELLRSKGSFAPETTEAYKELLSLERESEIEVREVTSDKKVDEILVKSYTVTMANGRKLRELQSLSEDIQVASLRKGFNHPEVAELWAKVFRLERTWSEG